MVRLSAAILLPLVVTICFWTLGLHGQTAAKAFDPDINGGLIKLDVEVYDQSGKPVPDLAPDDLIFADNGVPAKILSFQAYNGNSSPLEILFLIDEYNLSGALASHAKDEVASFLMRHNGHLVHPVSVFVLDINGIRTVAGPSIDGTALVASLRGHEKVGTWGLPLKTVLGPQSNLMALATLAAAERTSSNRKLLVWIGPGSGYGSGAYSAHALHPRQLFQLIVWFSTLLRDARITLYSASVGFAEAQQNIYTDYLKGVKSIKEAQSADLTRDVLAVQSGGAVLHPQNDLAAEMDRYITNAAAFYTVSFDPPKTDGLNEYHELSVESKTARLTVRTNGGYYNQAFYSYLPDPNVRRVTVSQLQDFLASLYGKRDGEIAKQLSGLELTERLHGGTLSSLMSKLHGEKSQQALDMLADMSSFLEDPPSEIDNNAAPTIEEQQRILSLSESYLSTALSKLPDFYARRTTAQSLATVTFDPNAEEVVFGPLHHVATSKATVLYRHGHEVVRAEGEKNNKEAKGALEFTTYGTFGPALSLMTDLLSSIQDMKWSRWEQSPAGRRAIFLVSVPRERSRYQLSGCCLPEGDGTRSFDSSAGYDVEVAIDPGTGAIYRFRLLADMRSFLPFGMSKLVVSYGPVDIGGQTYICPIKSVSILHARSVSILGELGTSYRTWGPYWTEMINFAFDEYHVFRSTSRILPNPPDGNH